MKVTTVVPPQTITGYRVELQPEEARQIHLDLHRLTARRNIRDYPGLNALHVALHEVGHLREER